MANSSPKYIFLLLGVVVSAILYTVILWYPLGGWILNNVIVGVNFGFSNPNIGEGLLLMLLSLILLVLLFILPFLFIWGVVVAVLIVKKLNVISNNQ